jgi:hypothetical protein
MTATGTTTPIAALAPVDNPPELDDELEVAEVELVCVGVGVGADRSLLCHYMHSLARCILTVEWDELLLVLSWEHRCQRMRNRILLRGMRNSKCQ